MDSYSYEPITDVKDSAPLDPAIGMAFVLGTLECSDADGGKVLIRSGRFLPEAAAAEVVGLGVGVPTIVQFT